ncbi:MAG: hypothetical protein IJW00_06985, partial [Clostridia bacterium]|nr:hypothetical protein [Clostridia bacterium]
DTYFTEDKVETTLEALTGAIPSHSYGDWKTDGANHWKECSCGDKKDSAAHSGGTATCEAKAKCAVCSAEYGDLAAHKYSEATCTTKAKCSVCGDETGELAAHKYSEATCTAKAKCSVCGDETGELAAHNYVDGKCECGETDPNYTPGTDEPGTDVPGTDEPGTDVPGTDEPGTDVPGTDEPGTDVPGTDEPGTDKPEDPEKNGCQSTIVGASAGFIAMAIIASLGIVLKKKKLL